MLFCAKLINTNPRVPARAGWWFSMLYTELGDLTVIIEMSL